LKDGWLHTRTFFLRDYSYTDASGHGDRDGRVETDKNRDKDNNDDEGEWFGRLKIYAQDTTTLARFRLDQLSLDTTWPCEGLNWDRQVVYSYERRKPSDAFNAIYDDMPLRGWWPWPGECGKVEGEKC
jgi:hypothetical protein